MALFITTAAVVAITTQDAKAYTRFGAVARLPRRQRAVHP